MSDEDVSSKLLTQVAKLTLRVSNLRAEVERLETERDEWKVSQARIEQLEAERDEWKSEAQSLEVRFVDDKARIEQLKAALQPLAKIPMENFDRNSERPDDYPLMAWDSHKLCVGHVREARAALARKEGT